MSKRSTGLSVGSAKFLSTLSRIYSSTSVMNVTKKPGMTARISGRKTRLSTWAPRKPT